MDVSTVSLLALFGIAVVPLLPTEVALIGLGVAAAARGDSLLPVILVAAAGCLISDHVLYTLGRHGGASALDRVRRRSSVDAGVRWLLRHLERRPVSVLVIARWLPSGGTAGALLAGSLRRPQIGFLVASSVGVLLWSTYAAALGYLGGQFVREPGISLLVSLGVAALLALVVAALVRNRTGQDLRHASGTAGGAALHPAEPA
ncbi:DedA family protein [Qaidamihabitans albus]|uniref:DedA family protein n=1 Tax=Qaidamihabitans albus TaxID=2795733 RepID=UPI0018F17132|nr:VTT domain-containing protein [Qaidamihabitans albus]